ncbi:MAG: N-acetylglucosamine-6-phosphate deacetylase [Planctomycetota bacterium]|jgi:N-acetylglucosamine-6-phosphate deacetylase
MQLVDTMPDRWALAGARAILPDRVLEDAWVEVSGGRIQRVGKPPQRIPKSLTVIDATGKLLAPGFVDIHVHGGAGADFMDGTPEAIAQAALAHLKHGTTTIFPTTTTGSAESIHATLDAVALVRQQPTVSLPWIPGVHLYGPYFASAKSGCHSKAGCRAPELSEYQSYFKTGLIRIATCAAELEGCLDFYRYAKRRKCLVTCGHSNSSWNEMKVAHRAGMSHVDHFWCAMSNVASVRSRFGTPMQGSMLEFVLAHSTMSTEVIADGYHLAPELLQFAWQIKGPQRLCLVTDSNRALDMPPGRYLFGNPSEHVWIESDGQVGRAPDGGLASAIQGMDHCIRVMAKHTEVPLHDIVRMASLTPATLTGIDDEVGSLEPGKRADILLLNRKLHIDRVFLTPSTSTRIPS